MHSWIKAARWATTRRVQQVGFYDGCANAALPNGTDGWARIGGSMDWQVRQNLDHKPEDRARRVPRKLRNKAIYETPVVKRGGAEFVSQGSRTSPSPSASVDLAHLRPRPRSRVVHPRHTSPEPEAEGGLPPAVSLPRARWPA